MRGVSSVSASLSIRGSLAGGRTTIGQVTAPQRHGLTWQYAIDSVGIQFNYLVSLTNVRRAPNHFNTFADTQHVRSPFWDRLTIIPV